MSVQVSILAVGQVQLPVGLGSTKKFINVTYSADGASPRIVYIEPEKDSPEERRRVIAEDIEKAKAEHKETFELP